MNQAGATFEGCAGLLLSARSLTKADDEARALLARTRLAERDDALKRDVEHLVILVNEMDNAVFNLHNLATQGRRAPAEEVNFLPDHFR
jgi:hypothetical protein